MPEAQLTIVFYTTYFELDMWRRGFLKNGARLKIYSDASPYTPFTSHSIVSLMLLELKTVIFLIPCVYSHTSGISYLIMLLAAIHVNWLFSISLGGLLSKDVFKDMAESTATFLCISILSSIGILILTNTENLALYWPIPNPSDASLLSSLHALLILIFIIIYVVAVYTNSVVARRNLRIESP
ncbi:MAG: hypothetical protein ACUVQ0_01195 [Thermoproteota archaeon]